MSNNIVENLQNDIINVNINFKNLTNTINKLDKSYTTNPSIISQLLDIEEITTILNEKICNLDDKIKLNNVKLSKYALERIKNNKIVLNALTPYIPFIILNLYDLNNT